jgi:hypothetical protein
MADLMTIINQVLGVMIICAIPWCLITVWSGVRQIRAGDPDGYNSLKGAAWIAIGIIVVSTMYGFINGFGGGIAPTFQ